ncbi:papilin-like isoform X2 [Aricia agestis]|uniref:papilin-like isoform X2 n=1 Tax=Aricia agestis TaxID=91739 RepID=UPI001C20ABDC|nr:papilin-like isoform X2 [Aricia agestis]
MGTPNIRSLLLAAIVLCNCITWTSSRHHYTHNVNGHRSRHRRQGAGLFLSASYVLPGGEGGGAWGEWGAVSPCSRTCGGGVASQKRICLEISPDGRPQCTGGDTKYFSCQTQDCPEGSGDFRAEQCAAFNDKLFRNNRYNWVPYTKAMNPCELNCMPVGERFYYRQKDKVTDGTRCNDETFDVCVDGTCQPVGCDMMLGSNAREDKCRQCRGNGTNCHTTSGVIDRQDLKKGYTDILLIPEGATNIVIGEVRNSDNYLALRGRENNHYYLNGDYHIDFPRTLTIAGCLWHYERSQLGFAAPDKLRCLGPTNESLYLSLLLQSENVGVEYEYSVPSALAPPPNQQYQWVHEEFSECSEPCGGGYQTRQVSCRTRDDLEPVEDELCDSNFKPATNQSCNTQACGPQWVQEPWGPCSKPCGEGGTRSREVYCQMIITNGETFRFPTRVADKDCFDVHGPKPELYQQCNQNETCPTWFTGPWKPCDKLCGEGKQRRQVVCHQKINGRVTVHDDSECGDEKPATEQPCTLHPCEGLDWVVSDWTGCDTCLSTVRTRSAWCVTKANELVNSSLCAYHPEPVLQEDCDKTKLPACEVQWYATQWSPCSSDCGKGVKTRKVFCGLFDGTSVLKVSDDRCDKLLKYNDTVECEQPKEKCPAKWFAGPWSECTKKCGGGEQFRHVVCMSGGKESMNCEADNILFKSQPCNIGPCDLDEMLPVDSKSTTVMDEEDYDDCIEGEDEDYEEVGAEVIDKGTTAFEDIMFSDSPSTIEGSGTSETLDFTLTTETGSGTSETEITLGETTEGSGEDLSTLVTETSESSESTLTDSSTEPTNATDLTTQTSKSSESTTDSDTEKTESTEAASTEIAVESSGSTTSDSSTELSGSTQDVSTETTESSETTTSDSSTEPSGTTEEITTETTDSSESTTDSSTESTETTEEITTETTDSSESTTDSSTQPTETTEEITTETTDSSESTTDSSTEPTETTQEVTTETTNETETTVTESESSETTTEISSISTDSSISTTESSDATTSSDVTEESTGTESSGASTEVTETESSDITTEITESTVESSSGTTESTEVTSETTEISGASTEETETTETTSETTEESGITSETSESGSTTESSTTENISEGSTTTEETEATSEDTTPWDWETTFITPKRCKPRKKAKCIKSKFGCCPDMRTPAAGPFDAGCPNPKTCKESKFGCCPDSVSPANGPRDKGCPITPCNETLFGCCTSDNVTAAEGNDQEGCPPPPPACMSSKFGCCSDEETPAQDVHGKGCPGYETTKTTVKTPSATESEKDCAKSPYGCCYDNETDASGPNGEGCPCSISQYGCCPDGVSTAAGPEMEGCVMSCNTSAYGCCSDGETPAHGPDYQGCCLLTAYGCCPDNYKPAEGPNLEGCGCQYAHYGCCPDKVTIARGPNNEGCGCQYTQFGCCPDRHTEATGPNMEGCGCNTYQFGCCADGETRATGPDQQGCRCETSKFGCCGDGVTAAQGPDKLGCDCSNSKYGCCPDGVTEAQGKKFLNCTDKLQNRQAACALAYDKGSCRNYTVYWYYDRNYGGCSRFWYSGCEGNDNRFSSQEECEDICVHPHPKDACNLPMVKGACTGYNVHWYYDAEREQCSQFVYGGCLGNNNKFDSRDLCQKQCEPEKTEDQCNLPIERGPCAGNYLRWGYDAESKSCREFVWGGCDGNNNRFSTEAACLLRCNPPGVPEDACKLPQDAGNCTEKIPTWSFNRTENQCVPFYYTGCGGNDNRFMSEQECTDSCPSYFVQDVCTLPALTGNCAEYTLRWFYDTTKKTCRQFYYGGCEGNENNFQSMSECENRCMEQQVTTTTVRPIPPQNQYTTEYCYMDADPGPCTMFEKRWAYDERLGTCYQFDYGGCGGNQNNFPTLEYCQHYCNAITDICQLPMSAGPCSEEHERWFYDADNDRCSRFVYGGCEGNDNRFNSREECENRCRGGAPPTTAVFTTTTPASEAVSAECRISPTLEQCVRGGRVWYYAAERRMCVSHDNAEYGAYCRHTGVFPSEETCERACGAFKGLEVCRYTLDAGTCNSAIPKFYFNQESGSCEQFTYGGCHGGPNRFTTLEECQQICQPDPCAQPLEPGNCLENIMQWYYEQSRDDCQQFLYTGCSGNDNRFETREECLGRCRKTPPAPTTTVSPPNAIYEAECEMPESLVPCGENVTIFYYDPAARKCVEGNFGGCRHPNSYRTEEECERRCGAFRGLDVCGSRLDPGPCSESVRKVYWDAAAGRCEVFAYGGCFGGPNRFSNEDECEEVCGGAGPGEPEAPSVDPATEDRVSGVVGGPVTLRCLFHGNPPPRITWRRGEITIDGDQGRYRLQSDGALEIVSLYRNDSGVYICIGENELGRAQQEIHLEVNDESTNEITPPDCRAYDEECASLRCEYGKQRTRTAGGCVRCECVHTDVDCGALRAECDRLQCAYGTERNVDDDGCERCRCADPPCVNKACAADERCVTNVYTDPISSKRRFYAECRIANKTGYCPREDGRAADSQCHRQCNDDADCVGVAKCCVRGCSQLCLEPVDTTPTPRPPLTPPNPDEPQPPSPDVEGTEPEVTASEGGKAALRCLFHGNPPPKIAWRRGEITIDGSVDRYRVLSDGTLEIVSLYRNDTGVYICIAENDLGRSVQEIRLEVNDPVDSPAGIAGVQDEVVVGDTGRPVTIRCLAYGYPKPSIFWYRGHNGPMVPFSSALYEARENNLLIRRLNEDTLGEYICQAYNGIGKPAEWAVSVRLAATTGEPLPPPPPRPVPQLVPPPTTPQVPVYTVPVTTSIAAGSTRLVAGAEINLPCVVDGYPEPEVHWTKDGVTLATSDRITVTEARLTVAHANTNDSGTYGCHAANAYSSHNSFVQITVEGLYIPPTCKDNPYFANCHLIVRSKYCHHKYYSSFCCKSCVEAGLLDPAQLEMQADEPWWNRK